MQYNIKVDFVQLMGAQQNHVAETRTLVTLSKNRIQLLAGKSGE